MSLQYDPIGEEQKLSSDDNVDDAKELVTQARNQSQDNASELFS